MGMKNETAAVVETVETVVCSSTKDCTCLTCWREFHNWAEWFTSTPREMHDITYADFKGYSVDNERVYLTA